MHRKQYISQDSRFSGRRRFKSWSSVLWRDDRGIKVLRKAGMLPHHYTASQSTRPRLDMSIVISYP